MRILMTGGNGLLGKHMRLKADRPSHSELDITELIQPGHYELIVNCAAYTDVAKAENDKEKCFDVNVQGVINLITAYPNTPFVQISTEYAHSCLNYYSLTKKLAEDQLKFRHPCYLIIRTLFKPYPWPYDYAFINQKTLGGYVDDVAANIDKAIMEWDRKTSRLIYVGDNFGEKTMYELAKWTKPDVKPNLTTDIKGVIIPTEYR